MHRKRRGVSFSTWSFQKPRRRRSERREQSAREIGSVASLHLIFLAKLSATRVSFSRWLPAGYDGSDGSSQRK